MQKPHDLGKSGEEIAANYLEKRGYVVLAKNYRYLKAEVDLIVQRENTIIGVEVKTRSTRDFGNPQDFIKKKQIQNLVLALDHFVQEITGSIEVRLDVIAIISTELGNDIEHIKDAFYHF